MDITNETWCAARFFLHPDVHWRQKSHCLANQIQDCYIYIYILVNIFLDISSYSPFDTSKYIKVMLYTRISLSPIGPFSIIQHSWLHPSGAIASEWGLDFHLQKRLRHHNMLGQLGFQGWDQWEINGGSNRWSYVYCISVPYSSGHILDKMRYPLVNVYKKLLNMVISRGFSQL